MLEPKIRVRPTPEAVIEEAARLVMESAQRNIALTGAFAIGLSGGTTPRGLYELLATPTYINKIDWSKVHVFFIDERCVPPKHEQSNFGLAQRTLLETVPVPWENVHRLRGEIDPQEAAAEYGRMLKERFGEGGLDMALLGMGEDGHTASLFPGTEALGEREHRCVAVFVPKLNAWRLTLTAPFINRSREIAILVTGANKAATVQQVIEGDRDPQRLPMQLIAPPEGQVYWLLDAAAAGMA